MAPDTGVAMGKTFWAARRPAWVAGGLVVAVAALTVWLLRARSGVNTATVLSLTVSVLSLAVAVRGLMPGAPLSRAARELAGRVGQERGRARRQALGMAGDARPANLSFRAPEPGGEPELVRWRCDGGGDEGTLWTVAGYYRSLDRGRLVVLGDPGAGKTVLATQLVIDLIDALPDDELRPGARPPVPVWLTLTSVDLGEVDSLDAVGAEELAARLDRQLAAQLSAVYQVSRSTAGRLLAERWVLPVLDGLDEMDPAEPEPERHGPARPRAAAVVRALNAGTGRRPVVLVCRRGEYGQLARSAVGGGDEPVLQDARQIVLQPLDVPAICDYLTRRFPGDRPGRPSPRWDGVLAALREPAAAGCPAILAQALSSPWRLFLAATAYQDEISDPDELLAQPADELGEYLLSALIPAVAGHRARPGGGRYPADQVHVWLSTLACHLQQTSSHPRLRWSPTELRLERLWPIGAKHTARGLTTLVFVVIVGAPVAVAWLRWGHAGHRSPLGELAARAVLSGGAALLVLVAGVSAYTSSPALRVLNLRPTSRARRAKLASWLIGGLATGLAGGLSVDQISGPAWSVAYVVAAVLMSGLVLGLEDSSSLAARPTTAMRQSIAYALAGGLAMGLVTGLLAGILRVTPGVGGPIAVGLSFGLFGGMEMGLQDWTRYLIGCLLARRHGTLPRRVGRFLDWAYEASLLRMSGTAAQFRHRELQDWLARHPVPPARLPRTDRALDRARSLAPCPQAAGGRSDSTAALSASRSASTEMLSPAMSYEVSWSPVRTFTVIDRRRSRPSQSLSTLTRPVMVPVAVSPAMSSVSHPLTAPSPRRARSFTCSSGTWPRSSRISALASCTDEWAGSTPRIPASMATSVILMRSF